MELNLQYFGGRGSSGGKGGSAGGSADRASIEKKIDKAGFKKQGPRDWEMEIDGVGRAWVFEDHSSRDAIDAGFGKTKNDKAYSYVAWRYNENGTVEQLTGSVDILPTLNEAKLAAKEFMKNHITR